MALVEDVIAVITLLSILFFVLFAVGLARLPTGQRPRTPVLDRYGEPLPPRENPGYRETEDERESGDGE